MLELNDRSAQRRYGRSVHEGYTVVVGAGKDIVLNSSLYNLQPCNVAWIQLTGPLRYHRPSFCFLILGTSPIRTSTDDTMTAHS